MMITITYSDGKLVDELVTVERPDLDEVKNRVSERVGIDACFLDEIETLKGTIYTVGHLIVATAAFGNNPCTR